jgi:hypothetical protein
MLFTTARSVVAVLVLALFCAGCGEARSAREPSEPQANTNPFYEDSRACGHEDIPEPGLYARCMALWF